MIENFLCYCRENDIEGVKWCLDKVDVNMKDPVYKITGFMWACNCYKSKLEVIKLLLENSRIDVNEKDICGYTGFMYACYWDDTEKIKLLLDDYRIDINLKNIDGYTGISITSEKGYIEIVKMIQKYIIKNSIKDNVEFNIN